MVYCDPMQYVNRSQRASNKRPLYATKIVLDAPTSHALLDAPYLNYSKILGISKIIQFIHFLA